MSRVLCVYVRQPSFPAADQHPDAMRYQVGGFWVDALDGEPTLGEVGAVIEPPPASSSAEHLVNQIKADPAALALLKAELAKV